MDSAHSNWHINSILVFLGWNRRFQLQHCGTNRHRLRHLKRQISLLRLVRVLPKPNVPNHLPNNTSRRQNERKRNILRYNERRFRQNKQRIHSYYYRHHNRQDPTRPQEPFQTQQSHRQNGLQKHPHPTEAYCRCQTSAQ